MSQSKMGLASTMAVLGLAMCLSVCYGNKLWWKAGSSVSINDISDTVTFGNGWATAYGSQLIMSGRHQWKLKILKRVYSPLYIGLSSTTTRLNSAYLFSTAKERAIVHGYCKKIVKDDRGNFYAYSAHGYIYDHNEWQRAYPGFHQPGKMAKYYTGDIITMNVDFESNEISFNINNTNLGIAFSSIDSDKYRLTISSGDNGVKIKVLSYENLSTEVTELHRAEISNGKQITSSWDAIILVSLVVGLLGILYYLYICKIKNEDMTLNEYQLEFKHWLFNVSKKGEYYELFCNEGYDDVRTLHLFTDNLLKEDIGINKAGHRAIILEESHKYTRRQEGNTAYIDH